MAQNSDKFIKVKRKYSTTVDALGFAQGATNLPVVSGAGLDEDTAIILTIAPGEANEEVIKGVYDGSSTVANCLRGLSGTSDQAHSAGEEVVMYLEERHIDDMVDGLLEEHRQDGTHRSDVQERAWPVGSVYINANVGTNPATLLGFGTWVSLGAGRVLVGVDDTDADFDTVGNTGGEKTHTLTDSELPDTNVRTTNDSLKSWRSSQNQYDVGGISGGDYNVLVSTASSAVGELSVQGGNEAHNNLQPYLAVHIWKRTA